MSNEITGIVKAKLDPIQRGSITMQTIAIELAGDLKYPEIAVIEFAGKSYEKVREKLNQLRVGQTVEVGFNYKGREWNGKWFGGLSGWKLFIKDGYQSAQQQTPSAPLPREHEEEDERVPF